jgi:23S rRNA pseudouridine2605 synthase
LKDRSKLTNDKAVDAPVRLQAYLAHAGVASRRSSEKLITEGRVAVNGRLVTVLGEKVLPGEEVSLDG